MRPIDCQEPRRRAAGVNIPRPKAVREADALAGVFGRHARRFRGVKGVCEISLRLFWRGMKTFSPNVFRGLVTIWDDFSRIFRDKGVDQHPLDIAR